MVCRLTLLSKLNKSKL